MEFGGIAADRNVETESRATSRYFGTKPSRTRFFNEKLPLDKVAKTRRVLQRMMSFLSPRINLKSVGSNARIVKIKDLFLFLNM